VIDGNGEQSMDFIHVHDIARSVVLALTAQRDNLPINIGTGVDTSIATLAEILLGAMGSSAAPIFNPRPVIASRRAADISRAVEVLGFKAEIDVRTGMAELIRGGK
jgi:UDP-glucose 4-epimerase